MDQILSNMQLDPDLQNEELRRFLELMNTMPNKTADVKEAIQDAIVIIEDNIAHGNYLKDKADNKPITRQDYLAWQLIDSPYDDLTIHYFLVKMNSTTDKSPAVMRAIRILTRWEDSSRNRRRQEEREEERKIWELTIDPSIENELEIWMGEGPPSPFSSKEELQCFLDTKCNQPNKNKQDLIDCWEVTGYLEDRIADENEQKKSWDLWERSQKSALMEEIMNRIHKFESFRDEVMRLTSDKNKDLTMPIFWLKNVLYKKIMRDTYLQSKKGT